MQHHKIQDPSKSVLLQDTMVKLQLVVEHKLHGEADMQAQEV
jgi:hypothetical protein